MSRAPVVEFRLGDVVRFRRPHPCGGSTWLIDRLGADLGLSCQTCGRHILIERRAVERRVTAFVTRGDLDLTAAVGPRPATVASAGSSDAGGDGGRGTAERGRGA